ncbi:SLC13 family permease [Nitrincola sp. MINF-07-Sa-05]|uniref:SLC13 family permease n=1 Tax=Nitrincola salilacus TaxID=3400273 RepID=UPI00391835FA
MTIRIQPLLVIIMALACLILVLFPPAMLSQEQTLALSLVVMAITLWATALLPEYLTALLFFLAAMLLNVADASVVFSGFTSTAIWLIFSGMVLGAAIKDTGLGDRIAGTLGRNLEHSYPMLISGIVIACVVLGFFMPSSIGRAVMMVPIAMALADRCQLASGSKGRTGVALAAAFGCHLPTFAILPSNIPNMVLVGAAETIYGTSFNYTSYLLLHFPLLGVVKAALVIWLILRFFPDQVKPHPSDFSQPSALNSAQKLLIMVLSAALFFWMTDSFHGINPAWVGLSAAVFLLLPRVGVVDSKSFAAQVNLGILLFISAILGLGAIINATGLGAMLGEALINVLPLAPGRDFVNFISLILSAFLTGIFTTLPGVPAVLTPIAGDLAQQSGWSLEAVLMTQVIGFSTILLPYQSGPLVVAMLLARESVISTLKLTLPLVAITLLLLVPLDYLWWKFLGWI